MSDENGRAGRERTRRRKSGGLAVFLTILFIAVIGAVGSVMFFRVSEVEIEGESRYSDEQIIAASGIEMGDSMVLLRVGNETWLLDSDMKALEETDGLAVKKYTFIKGFTSAEATAGRRISVDEDENTKLRYSSEVLSGLEELGIIGDVTLVDVSNISGITVHYQDRFRVKLGTGENIQHKLARLGGIIPYLNDDDRGVIDVSGDSESYFIPD